MIRFKLKNLILNGLFLIILFGCSSKFLKYEGNELSEVQHEFAQQVKILDAVIVSPKDSGNMEDAGKLATTSQLDKTSKKKITSSKKKLKDLKKAVKSVKAVNPGTEEVPPPLVHLPDIEDSIGFKGRRPIVDPFRVGEEVVHSVRYFKVSAGEFKFKVEPFVKVNDHISYKWVTEITTSSMFNSFYSAEDRVETLVDYETLVPWLYELHVKESGQLREGRSFFDHDSNIAKYSEKKVTKDSGLEEKKQEWEILPFSQNVFSAIFYMRTFSWEVGKVISFRVANDKENLIFKATALRRELIDTELGEKMAIVIKPEITVKGFFKPFGDVYIWLSDDDRKYVLRTESKIKVGTIVSEVIRINPGSGIDVPPSSSGGK